ncbi:hypothetical protein HZ326_10894 [Fusarium oxysporum f. sp. albedinis]|nr:hypothetical protein HZ326_10894 [Fusarium oxysporum f. sp. albedinis]
MKLSRKLQYEFRLQMAFAYPEHSHLKVQKTSSNSSYLTVIMHFEISPEWIIKSHEYFERINSVNIFSFKKFSCYLEQCLDLCLV